MPQAIDFENIKNRNELFRNAMWALNDASLQALQLRELLDMLDMELSSSHRDNENLLRRVHGVVGAALTLAEVMYTSSDKNYDGLDGANLRVNKHPPKRRPRKSA